MRQVTFALSIVLLLLGVGLYLGSGAASVTALIPAFFGLGFGLCGWIASTPTRTRHAMHAASVLALLGVAGSARGIPGVITLLSGGSVERPSAVWGQTAMALLCLTFLVLAVRSFIAARRARTAEANATA